MSDQVKVIGLGVSFVCPERHVHVQTQLPLDQVYANTEGDVAADVACGACEGVHYLLVSEG